MSLGLLSLTWLQNPYCKWNFKISINLLTHQSPMNLWILHWVSADNRLITSVLGNFKQTALLIPHPVELGAAGTAVVRHSTVPHKTTVKAGWAHWLELQPPHTLEEQLFQTQSLDPVNRPTIQTHRVTAGRCHSSWPHVTTAASATQNRREQRTPWAPEALVT